MKTSADVVAIQRCYPQIYLACHTRHTRARSSATHISPRDSSILAHLDDDRATAPADLARHLGVGASTLSAAIKRLAALGYVATRRHAHDSRRQELRLTRAGARAMSSASVLDPQLVEHVLTHLSTAERRQAVAGLALLARASRLAARSDG
jgi:DNA-binding MarR family transcriptional regulator